MSWENLFLYPATQKVAGERGGSVVECRTPEREVRGSRPTAAVLCPWARHFTPRKYWLITQEAMAPSRHDWKIVDWDVKPQHNQPTKSGGVLCYTIRKFWVSVRPSGSDSFLDSNFSSFWQIFFKLCTDIDIGKEWIWDCKWAKFIYKQ